MSFEEIRIGDVLTLQRGFDITKAEQSVGEIPIVSSSGTSSYHNQWKVEGPGVVIGRKGTLGTTHYLNCNFWPHDTTLWIKDFKGNDPKFLYYFLQTLHLENFDTGSSNPTLNRNHLHKIKVLFPEKLAVQEKIAAILSTYDDLIANNQRRITLLERMAEDIYREWFVRLRFPGHENVKIEKGVPQGWGFVALSEIASINASSLKKGSETDRIQYIDISAVTTNHIGNLSEIALANAPGRARRLVKHGDVIWSSVRPANRAYCLIYEPPKNLVASTGFAVISPKPEVPFTFINFAVTSDSFVEQMAMVAKGAAYPATSFDDFGKALVLRPSADLLARFHAQCEPMFKRRYQLRRTNAALAQQRDALLPRLISGKLSVDALDIRFPPGMVDADL